MENIDNDLRQPIMNEDSKVPSSETRYSARPLIPTSFGLAIICFFFTFCELKCGGETFSSVTGINFVTGTELKDRDLFSGEEIEGKKVPANIWAILALGSAIVGLAIYLLRDKNEGVVGTVAGVAGFVSLLLLQFAFKKSVEGESEGQIEILFQFGYWGALILMIIAGVLSFFGIKQVQGTTDGGNNIIET